MARDSTGSYRRATFRYILTFKDSLTIVYLSLKELLKANQFMKTSFSKRSLKNYYRAIRHQRGGGSIASSSGSNQRLDPKLRWVDAAGRRKLPKTRQIINRAKISVPPESNVFSQSTIFRDSNEKLCNEKRYLNCNTV